MIARYCNRCRCTVSSQTIHYHDSVDSCYKYFFTIKKISHGRSLEDKLPIVSKYRVKLVSVIGTVNVKSSDVTI